jgi:hypothetical protein
LCIFSSHNRKSFKPHIHLHPLPSRRHLHPFTFAGGKSSVFFGMGRRRLRPQGRIRPSPPYPCSGDASSAGGERVKSCVRRFSWDPVSSHSLVWFQVSHARSIIIGDGCCSGRSLSLSMTTSHLSTTISFAWLR